MKEILRNVVQKVQRECNRRENKRQLMSMVAMLCVFSIVSTSVMQSSMIQVAANARTGSNAIETSSNVATPSDADNDVSGGTTGGTSSGAAEVQTPSNATEVQTPSDATDVATPSDAVVVTYEPELICTVKEHMHDGLCWGDDDFICGLEEHTHDENCYAPYTPTEDEMLEINYVIELISKLPTYEEIENKLAEYEELEDWDGYEEYFVTVADMVYEVHVEYMALHPAFRPHVSNRQLLLELEWIWQATPLVGNITSATPTTVKTENTSDFITLNLYDYTSTINDKYNNAKNITYRGYNNANGWHNRTTSKYPGFQWNGGAYVNGTYDRHNVDFIDFGNSMITDIDYAGSNNAKSTTSTDIVVNDNWLVNSNSGNSTATKNTVYHNINLIDVDINDAHTGTNYGVTNRPVGMSLNSSITSTTYDVMKRTLVKISNDSSKDDYYPALRDGTSLSYLFNAEEGYAIKKNTTSINGLFQKNEKTGEYYFNSRDNHAQYSNNKFTVYNQILTPNFIVYPFGNFLPLNDITNGANATQISKITSMNSYINTILTDLKVGSEDATENQLITMLGKYQANVGTTKLNGWTAKDAIKDYFIGDDSGDDKPSSDTSPIDSVYNKIYNIDWDVDTNFFFGMDMSMRFMQPRDGYTGKDTDGDGKSDYPMKFYFTGDDDVWVYIDGVLFLDLTGIHRHVGGEIDFVNGKVNYYPLSTSDGDISKTAYKTYSFKEILNAAGADTSVLNSKGTFKNYSQHDFKFYYMERGSGSSVCRLNFNFPLLRKLSVAKELTIDEGDLSILGNPDFTFQVLDADTNKNFFGSLHNNYDMKYDIYEMKDGKEVKVGEGQADTATGIFTLKAGQKAVFDDIDEDAGKYYVVELFDPADFEQYGTVTVGGSTITTNEMTEIVTDSGTFMGAKSPTRDITDGNTLFTFNNKIAEHKLGTLEIAKDVTDDISSNPDYVFEVTIGGKPIPVGNAYILVEADGTTSERSVTTAGNIVLKKGQKAQIKNIITGTSYNVKESDSSAFGYELSYVGNTTGTIKHTEVVTVTAKNKPIKVPFSIPVVKNVEVPESKVHTFKFNLVEVDSNGMQLNGGYSDTLDIEIPANAISSEGTFVLPDYIIPDLGSLPAKRYYKLTEVCQESNVIYDSSEYIVTVTIEKEASTNKFIATSTVTQNGTSATNVSFTNILLGTLRVEKDVRGGLGDINRKFPFTISVEKEGTFTAGSIKIEAKTKDKVDISSEVVVSSDGKTVTCKLADGDYIEISGLPLGTKVSVSENYTKEQNESQAYIVTAVQGFDENGNDGSSLNVIHNQNQYYVDMTLDGENGEIVFINTKDPRPDTGILLDSWPYLLILVIALAGITGFVIHKRKETDLD